MTESGAMTTMPRPKKKRPVGRPPEADPLRSLVSVKGSTEFERWLDGLVDLTHQGTRSLLVRNALRVFAEANGYQTPQPKR